MDIIKISKFVAYGAVGFYLFQVITKGDKARGSLIGGNPHGFKVEIDKDKLVDSVLPWVDVNPHYRAAMGQAIKSFFNGK